MVVWYKMEINFQSKGSGKVHMFQPKFRTNEVLDQIKECLDIGWTGDGFKTREFELAWCKYSGVNNALYLNSSTSGLFLVIEMLKHKYNWNSDCEIISTPITFISTNHAILNAGLTPVFADVDESLNLSPDSVEQRITDKTKAIMFVGIGGNVQNYTEILAICKKYELLFILDAAHMSGSKVDNRQIGWDADFAIYSYQAVKNCPSSDSGLIVARNEEDVLLLKERVWLGISKNTFDRSVENSRYAWKYSIDVLSNKYNGNSIAACLALVSLKYLDEDNKYRDYLCQIYDEALNKFDDNQTIRVVKHLTSARLGIQSSRHLYQILIGQGLDRDKVIDRMHDYGVFPGVHYISTKNYGPYKRYSNHATPVADHISESVISLPLHLNMDDNDVFKVVKSLVCSVNSFNK